MSLVSLPKVAMDPLETIKVKDIECSICQEFVDIKNDAVTLCCSHTFHQSCIFSWWYTLMPKSANCPSCRHTFPELIVKEPDKEDFTISLENTDGIAGFLGIVSSIAEAVTDHVNENMVEVTCRECNKKYKNLKTCMRHFYFYHNYINRRTANIFSCSLCGEPGNYTRKQIIDHLISQHNKPITYSSN